MSILQRSSVSYLDLAQILCINYSHSQLPHHTQYGKKALVTPRRRFNDVPADMSQRRRDLAFDSLKFVPLKGSPPPFP